MLAVPKMVCTMMLAAMSIVLAATTVVTAIGVRAARRFASAGLIHDVDGEHGMLRPGRWAK